MLAPLVATNNLNVSFGSPAATVRAVADVSITIPRGEIVGIAGESGSGKSTLCAALIRALPQYARVSGEVLFEGRSLYALSASELRRLRRHELAMVLQNPMTSLDPMFTIGNQLDEVIETRAPSNGRQGRPTAVDLLRRVHITAPELRLRQYPHEMSGGMKQRILIAMATSSSPKLLIADEPTSALDATIQEEILLLFREIRDMSGASVVIVSHDLGAVRRVCDRTIIMYAGRIVEDGPTSEVFSNPRHPYTKALLASVPSLVGDEVVISAIPGQVPNLARLGPGCAFAERCTSATDQCVAEAPPERRIATDHHGWCWNVGA